MVGRFGLRRFLHGVAVTSGLAAIGFTVFVAAQPVVLSSDSMAPGMQRGDVVLTRPIAAGTVRVGDVIVRPARPGGGTAVTHRVTSVMADGAATVIVTKGDANLHEDPTPYRAEGTVRVATRVVPMVGYPFLLVWHPAARAALVVVPAIILLATRRRVPVAAVA